MHHTDYLYMLKFHVLITFTIIIITLTVNPYLIPQVISSSEPSSLSPEGSGDGDESNGSEEMNKGDLINKLTEDEGDNTRDLVDDNGIRQTDEEQDLTGDDEDGADEEPPTSTERGVMGGNPLEGLNVNKAREKADCERYLKSLGGSDDTNIGDTIEIPFGETREEYCKRILGGEGIDISNTTTTTATNQLMNQTDLVSTNDSNNSTEGELVITEEGTSSPCIVITEEGMPSGPNRPEPPQPSPSPKPC